MVPSAARPVWPARNTVRPVATTAWAKPEGRASSGGLTRSITTDLLSRFGCSSRLRGPTVDVDALARDRPARHAEEHGVGDLVRGDEPADGLPAFQRRTGLFG